MRSHLPFIIFFLVFLAIGLSIYTDYGISWDETISHDNNGVFNCNFIKTHNAEPLLKGLEKYHGPAFEIFLVGIEKMLGLKTLSDIYFMRHLVTFLVFAISVIFFYLICARYLKSRWLAVIGSVFLVLSPRIFADSFYNSKDLTFMCFVIISLYTTLRFLEKQNFKTGIFNAIATGLVIAIRIPAIIIPCFTFLLLFIQFIKKPDQRKKIILYSFLYGAFLAGTIILCWPVLWLGPVKHFILAFKEMSNYPWNWDVLYNGQSINATVLPWHYIPVWILISTPILYTILFFTGLIFLIKQFVNRINLTTFEWLNLYMFFVPILSVIFLHSIVYDGWRHMYFIYPSFLLIGLIGVDKIFQLQIKTTVIKLLKGVLLLSAVYVSYIMLVFHPYEHLYFNFLGGKSLEQARDRYEMDYWGLSYKQGLEYIVKNDSSDNIVIGSAEPWCALNNSYLLTEEQRARVSFTPNIEMADYFITSYRHHFKYKYKPDYDVIRDDGIILSIYDLRKKTLLSYGDKFKTVQFNNTFENTNDHWSTGKIIFDKEAYSASHVELVDSLTEYSSSFEFHPLPEQIAPTSSRNYISINFLIKTPSLYDMRVVFQIDSANSKTYEWQPNIFQSTLKDKWMKRCFRLALPQIYSSNDNMRVYIWNSNKNNFSIDNMEIIFYRIPENEVNTFIAAFPQ